MAGAAFAQQLLKAPSSAQPAVAVLGRTNVLNNETYGWVLSNRTVLVLSKLRGTEPHTVKINSATTNSVRFEVEVASGVNPQREAAALSKDFGPSITVILDEVAANGKFRTNFVFRDGEARKTITPATFTGLAAGARRMLVLPDSGKPAAPGAVRVIQ